MRSSFQRRDAYADPGLGRIRLSCAGYGLGIAPGALEPPSYALPDEPGEGVGVVGTQAGDPPSEMRTTYVSRARLHETARLAPHQIPGALAADGGLAWVKGLDLTYASSASRAMRVEPIEAGLARRQRVISLTAPPSEVNVMGGPVVTAVLPGHRLRRDGTCRITRIVPAQSLLGEDGRVALRCPLVAVQHAESIFQGACRR